MKFEPQLMLTTMMQWGHYFDWFSKKSEEMLYFLQREMGFLWQKVSSSIRNLMMQIKCFSDMIDHHN